MKNFSNKMLNRTVIAILVLLSLCFYACDGACEELGYLDAPFTAEVSGEVDGIAVEAEIFCDPTEHKTKEIYNLMTLRFSSPGSLEGMTVTLRSDGRATVRLKGMEEEQPLYYGFSEPYLALFQGGEVSSKRKTAEGYEIVFADGENSVTLSLDGEKTPTGVRGSVNRRAFSLKVTNFQQTKK